MCEIVEKICDFATTNWISLVGFALSAISIIISIRANKRSKARDLYEIKCNTLKNISEYLESLASNNSINQLLNGSVNQCPLDESLFKVDLNKCYSKKCVKAYEELKKDYSNMEETDYFISVLFKNLEHGNPDMYDELKNNLGTYYHMIPFEKEEDYEMFSKYNMACNIESYGIQTLNLCELLVKHCAQISNFNIKKKLLETMLQNEIKAIK